MVKTKILDGNIVKQKSISNFKKRILKLKKNNINPFFSIILVGENEASKIYIKNKMKFANELGVEANLIKFPAKTSTQKIIGEIKKLNNNKKIHGIILQLPLPDSIDVDKVLYAIDPKKDVDGIHPLNQGIIYQNSNVYAPKACTAIGIIELLKYNKIKLKSKKVLVIGRSRIVGKPLISLMLNENVTVTNLHSDSSKKDFEQHVATADIIVIATGKKNLISPKMVSNKQVIVDVGIHREKNGAIRGDLDYKKFINKVSWITKTPGGVGPMTITMLLNNLITLCETYY